MIINDKRALAYITEVTGISPIEGANNIELAGVLGWKVIVKKGEFNIGDKAIYFEIDSKVPQDDERFAFLEKKKFKIKTMKLGKFNVISQGLLMPLSLFPELKDSEVGTDVTEKLKVVYSVDEDNERKGKPNPNAKYMSMKARHKKIFSKKWTKWLMKREWGRKVMFFFFGKKKDNPKNFPTHFPGVSKTDQERIENMPWVLKDKTPFIVTQKCDGSSGTFILERKGRKKFKFYVCSRNVLMSSPEQECFYGKKNYYWEAAIKYNIEEKMKDYLLKNPDINFVCWQGEICAPGIQKNPHNLSELHFYCFHMTDSKTGRFNILAAEKIWEHYDMEVVPIVDTNYILPDDFEELKLSADGFYSPYVCEGKPNCLREGFVYYKTDNPNFSFKNVSREYLLKRNQ